MSHISNEKSVYPRNGSNRKKILLVTVRPFLSDAVADYALHLAARLEHELLVLIVDTQWEGARFAIDAAKTRRSILQKAKVTGSECSLIVKQGDLGLAVEGVNRDEKRIEFAIVDETINREAINQIALPLFKITSNPLTQNGGVVMNDERPSRKKKQIAATVCYGCLSAGLYAALFLNMETVMEYFTRGGMYAALPTGTALLFSFSHSAFASSTYSLLGIEAAKNKELRKAEQKVIEKKKQARKKSRPRLYVNPFHRI